MKNLVIGLILIAVLGLVLYFAPQKSNAPTTGTNNAIVTDYASCVSAGFPIAQTQLAHSPQRRNWQGHCPERLYDYRGLDEPRIQNHRYDFVV
jgi:hypothetical protein